MRTHDATRTLLSMTVFVSLLAVTVGPTRLAAADTLKFSAAADNTLFEDPEGLLSSGSGGTFYAGRLNSGLIRRGLVRFDLASLPAGAIITDASLTLQITRTVAGNQVVDLHNVLASWGEGLSNGGFGGAGVGATLDDATWAHRFSDGTGVPAPLGGTLWTNLGGDYDSSILASRVVGGVGTYTWTSAGLTAAAINWQADPASNFGLVVIGNEETNRTVKEFATRENGEPTWRPTLTLSFIVPGPGAGVLIGLGAVMAGKRKRRATSEQR